MFHVKHSRKAMFFVSRETIYVIQYRKNQELGEYMRKIAFIINPVAGNGKTIDSIVHIKSKLDTHKDSIYYEIHLSKFKGDITNLSKMLCDKGFDEFVAVGGDGTVSELINGLEYKDDISYKVGIIPWGTGNDLIKSLNTPSEINEILDMIIKDHTLKIDLGVANNHYFINVASVGIDGQIIKDTEKLKKIFPGHPAYLLSTIKAGLTFKSNFVKVKIDDRMYSGNMILIAIGNGKYFGGGMNICPNAKLDDNVFEICLVNNISKMKFMREISKVYEGRLGEVKEVIYERGKEVSIEVEDSSYDLNIDGNLVDKTPVNFKISPHKVKIFTNLHYM